MSTITADYQVELADSAGNTILMGDGTGYVVRSVEGLGSPPVRASDSIRPRDHGSWIGSDYLDARTVTVTAVVTGATAADTVGNVNALKALFAPNTVPGDRKRLSFRLPGEVTKQVVGRTRRLDVDLGNVQDGYVPVVCEFFANDPWIMSANEYALDLPYAAAIGGRTYDRTYDVTYGPSQQFVVQVTNLGNFPARPTISLFGPLNRPSVTNQRTGQRIELNLEIAAGSRLDISVADRTVTLDGSASRYFALSRRSSWWELLPGRNTIRLRDRSSDNDGYGQIFWHDTWL